ncbi:MAG: sugar ABC transporter substrate-binding protein [Firmicutes bacterium]|nr:sugar ABC transporter substrate-binding protein [Bacillota bacterium]
MYDKLKVRIASGNPPDLTRIVVEEYQGLAERGAFLDIAPYIEKAKKKDPEFKEQMDDYIDILLDAAVFKDSIYGLPADWNDGIIFYNKDLFDQAGLDYPSDDWTVENFLETAKKLTKDTNNDGRIDQYGYLVTGNWFDCIAPWIYTFGGRILTDDWTKSALNEPGSIEGISFINDLVNKYKVSPSPTVMKQMGGEQFFMSGKVAMAHYGRYMVPAFRKLSFDWDVVEQPVGPNEKRGVPYGVAFISASSKTKYPEVAFDFIRFYSSKINVQLFNELGNSIPVLESVVEKEDFINPDKAPKNQWAMIDEVKYARLIPSPPGNAEIIEIATSKLDELLVTNELTVEEVAEQITEEINEILNNN